MSSALRKTAFAVSLVLCSATMLGLSYPSIITQHLEPIPSIFMWYYLAPLFIFRLHFKRYTTIAVFVIHFAASCFVLCWLPESIYKFGVTSSLYTTTLLWVIVSLYVSLFPSISCCLAFFICNKNKDLYLIAILPVFLTAGECFRSSILGGFDWTAYGYSQANSSLLLSITSIVGVHGVSYLIALYNTIFGLGISGDIHTFNKAKALAIIMIMMAPIATLAPTEKFFHTERTSREGLKIAVTQLGLSEDEIHDVNNPRQTFTNLEEILELLAEQGDKQGAEVIIYPEMSYFASLRQGASIKKGNNGQVVIGGTHSKRCGKEVCHYNSAALVNTEGKVINIYHKQKLVPIAEQKFCLGERHCWGGEFAADTKQSMFSLNGYKLQPLICFESLDNNIVREAAKNGADALVNISGDLFQDNTSMPLQHLAISRFRSAETGLPMFRSSTRCGSAIIDSTGMIIEEIPCNSRGIVVAGTPPKKDNTIYNKYGYILEIAFPAIAMAIIIAFALGAIIKRRSPIS